TYFFFSSGRRHTRWPRDWSSDVCASDLGGHDDFFADAVDWWIGGLREELLEIIEQLLGLVRQHRQRSIGAHRADRLVAVARHWEIGRASCRERVEITAV